MAKRNFAALLLLVATITAFAAPKVQINSIQPPHWWVGMKDNTLQLQVYGPDIKPAEVRVNYPGVTIDSVARLDGSNNYMFVYLTIAPDAKPGKMPITFTLDGKKKKVDYELRERNTRGAQGFDASDVLYMIMPDRFANGNPSNDQVKSMRFPVGADRDNPNHRHGGDIKGIVDNIAYLDSLGITTVWVNPVLENDMPGGSYHGYSTTDYYKIDPRFGSNDDYTNMIETLHQHGIKTVMDMIFNHSGSEHIWNLDRPSTDWINFPDNYVETNHALSTVSDPYASDYDKQICEGGWFVRSMPDLNQRNPHLMKYLIQNSIWWVEESGIDGIRMDTYPYADKDEMGRWIEALLNEYPNFNVVGECWFAEPAQEAYWQTGSALDGGDDSKLPTVMDFPLMTKSRDMAIWREQSTPYEGLRKLYNHFSMDNIYADPMKVLRFLDNHDTERFIQTDIDSLDQWKQAIAMLLTVPGIPQIYYGTELLMSGTRAGGDGNIRKDVPGGWPGDPVNSFTRQGRTDLQNEAFDFMSKIMQWRKGSEAIAKGSMKHFLPNNGIYLYERKYGDDQVIVVFNGMDSENVVDMARYTEIVKPGQKFIDVISGVEIELIPADGSKRTFVPRETLVLQIVK